MRECFTAAPGELSLVIRRHFYKERVLKHWKSFLEKRLMPQSVGVQRHLDSALNKVLELGQPSSGQARDWTMTVGTFQPEEIE